MTDPQKTTSSYISFDKEQDYDVSKMMVFTGNANPALAERVAERLDLDLGQATVSRFSDGEVSVEIQENVRGKSILFFLLQQLLIKLVQ